MVVQFDILSNICLIFFQKKSVIFIVKTKEDKKSNFPCFVLAEQVPGIVNKFKYLGRINRQ